MLEVVRARKTEYLEQIMVWAHAGEIITNDMVEMRFKVSDATATNYLHELVKTGRLKMLGHDGGTTYAVNAYRLK